MDTCSICLDTIQEKHITRIIRSFGHIFHFACCKQFAFTKGNFFVNSIINVVK